MRAINASAMRQYNRRMLLNEIRRQPVSRAELVPGELTTAYDSAVVHGQATVVRDSAEKLYALKLLVQALDPVSMERAVMCADKTMERTMIVKITPREVSGKQSHGD